MDGAYRIEFLAFATPQQDSGSNANTSRHPLRTGSYTTADCIGEETPGHRVGSPLRVCFDTSTGDHRSGAL